MTRRSNGRERDFAVVKQHKDANEKVATDPLLELLGRFRIGARFIPRLNFQETEWPGDALCLPPLTGDVNEPVNENAEPRRGSENLSTTSPRLHEFGSPMNSSSSSLTSFDLVVDRDDNFVHARLLLDHLGVIEFKHFPPSMSGGEVLPDSPPLPLADFQVLNHMPQPFWRDLRGLDKKFRCDKLVPLDVLQ